MPDLENLADIQCDLMSKKFPIWQSITVGRSIVCDGYHDGKTTAVFSHFHEDHVFDIGRALTGCHDVIMSPITYKALLGMGAIYERATIRPLSENDVFHTDLGEEIRLLNANHVPGSMQVLVTMEDSGEKILYSGDFCYPGMPVPKADVLVLEPDHGDAAYDFSTDRESVLRRVFDKTLNEIEHGKPVEIKAHAGTMQSIMAQLEKTFDGMAIPEKVPFLADERSVKLTNAIKGSYDVEFREIEFVSTSRLNELYGEGRPYVLFSRHGATRPGDRETVIHVDANSGFKKNGPFFTFDNHTYFACFASHSSFSHVMEYVRAVDPELVIIDGTRANVKTGNNLQYHIKNDLDIPAVVRSCES